MELVDHNIVPKIDRFVTKKILAILGHFLFNIFFNIWIYLRLIFFPLIKSKIAVL